MWSLVMGQVPARRSRPVIAFKLERTSRSSDKITLGCEGIIVAIRLERPLNVIGHLPDLARLWGSMPDYPQVAL